MISLRKNTILIIFFLSSTPSAFAQKKVLDTSFQAKGRQTIIYCEKAFDLIKQRVDSLEKNQENNWKEHDESTIKEIHAMSWLIETLTVIFTIILIKGELEKWRQKKEFKRKINEIDAELENIGKIKTDLLKQDKYTRTAVDNIYKNVFIILDCIGGFKDRSEASRRVNILRTNLTKEREKLNLLALDPKVKITGIRYLHQHGSLQDLEELFEIKMSIVESQDLRDAAKNAIEEIGKRYNKKLNNNI